MNNINWQPKLKGALVTLKPLSLSDFELLYQCASDPQIWEQHPIKDRYKWEVFQTFFDSAIACKTAFLVLENETNAVMGSTRFYEHYPIEQRIAIGYTFLAKKYWGGKYNKEIKTLMMNYAFGHVQKILFHIGDENYRSQKAIEKLGGVKLRMFDIESGGVNYPHYEYGITKEVWEKTVF